MNPCFLAATKPMHMVPLLDEVLNDSQKQVTIILFITVTMNSRDRYEIIGLHKISHFINNLAEMFAWKNIINAPKLLIQCSTLAKQSGK